jgi:hypothetical protein
MSRTYKDSQGNKGAGRDRRLSVRAVRRDPPDLRKLSQALIQLALAQAADEAAATQQAEHRAPDAGEQTDG